MSYPSVSSNFNFYIVITQENLENRVNCRTPLLLKPSPKLKTPDSNLHDKQKSAQSSSLPLHRTPRGPPVDLAKKKHVCIYKPAREISILMI